MVLFHNIIQQCRFKHSTFYFIKNSENKKFQQFF